MRFFLQKNIFHHQLFPQLSIVVLEFPLNILDVLHVLVVSMQSSHLIPFPSSVTEPQLMFLHQAQDHALVVFPPSVALSHG